MGPLRLHRYLPLPTVTYRYPIRNGRWVLSDYTSPQLNLADPSVFRDLSRPMGAQEEAQREEIQAVIPPPATARRARRHNCRVVSLCSPSY